MGAVGGMLVLALAALPVFAGPADQPTPVTGDAWTAAIDAYLDSSDPRAIAPMLQLAPDALREQARAAREAWRRAAARTPRGTPGAAAAQRRHLRRLQAAALVPLELLLPLSGLRTRAPEWDALEDVAVASWQALPDVEASHREVQTVGRQARHDEQTRLERFRVWWRVAYLQYLLNVSRLNDFGRQAARLDVDGRDATLRAEYALLRGMAEETVARLSDQGPPGRLQNPTLDARLPAARVSLERATTWYRRTLEASNAHDETRLRLGRVLLERRQYNEALQVLTTLAAPRCEQVACGLAWMFVGEIHESRLAADRAAAAYARASSVLGVRQSALLALMQLALRRGNGGGAFALTGQLLASAPLSSIDLPDAWSVYVSGRRLNGEAVLAPLRAAALP